MLSVIEMVNKMVFDFFDFNILLVRQAASVEYDGQLSATAYIILAVVLLGIIAGLGWCFYRAIKAEDRMSEPQKPDEIGN